MNNDCYVLSLKLNEHWVLLFCIVVLLIWECLPTDILVSVQ